MHPGQVDDERREQHDGDDEDAPMALFIVAAYPLSARRRRSSSLPSRSTLVRCETMSSSATSMRLAVMELPP